MLAAAALLVTSAQADPIERDQLHWQTLANPAAPGSLAPRLAQVTDGSWYLSWLEKQTMTAPATAGRAVHALKFARLQTGIDQLSFAPARSIASGPDWFANWADTPALYVHSDKLWLAHWLQKSAASTYAYDIMLSTSNDQGTTWSTPFSPHTDNTPSEHGFISYFPLSEQSLGIIWLDGRETVAVGANHQHAGAMTLRAAMLDADGAISDGELLDQRVCDCCQTAAVNTATGTIIAFRDRSADEIRDIAVMRHTGQGWSKPQIVHADGWRTAACPVNGPALAARDNQVALAWFTLADALPRVQLVVSADGAETFTTPQVFSSGTALGRVQLLAYADGWLLSWMDQPLPEAKAVIRLARLNAAGDVLWQQQLQGITAQRASGIPRMAALADGRILMAWTGAANGQSQIHTSVFDPSDE